MLPFQLGIRQGRNATCLSLLLVFLLSPLQKAFCLCLRHEWNSKIKQRRHQCLGFYNMMPFMFGSIYQDFLAKNLLPINKSNMELDNQQSILYSRNCNFIGFKQSSCGKKLHILSSWKCNLNICRCSFVWRTAEI